MIKNLSLGATLLGLCTIGAVATMSVAGAAHWGLGRASASSMAILASGSEQRSQMQADMMHDALRGDVVSALLAAERGTASTEAAAIARDVAEHGALLRESLVQVRAAAVDSAVASLLARVAPVAERYATTAAEVVRLAGSDRTAAYAKLPEFLDSFDALETDMGTLGDLIAEHMEEVESASTAAAESLSRAMWLFGVVAAALTLALGVLVSRRIVATVQLVAARVEQLRSGCITNVENALGALARGETGVRAASVTPALEVTSHDEIGKLSETVNGIIAQTASAVEAFNSASATLGRVIGETNRLVQSASAGQLDARADSAQFEGGFRDLVEGVNETLDAMVAPITEAAAVLERVAERDLSARMVGEYRGDHARIKQALNVAVEHLDDALEQVAATSTQVAAAASQIASGSQLLAQGTSEQAASLEEVSASLQEFGSMAKQMAGNASETQSLTDGARTSAQRGTVGMSRMTDAVSRIQSSAAETAKIVRTIDEIAFQTNLLALNAAVEAARAGDAGRGFAVVAEEVRNLAIRSAEAAKQTAALIEGSVRNADDGVSINRETLENFRDIDERVNKVSELIAEVAAATEQQALGVQQITAGTDQLNEVTQQAAANAEESAAAAEQLTAQAASLAELAGSFQLSSQGDGRASAPARRAPAAVRPAAVRPAAVRPAAVVPAPTAWARKAETSRSAPAARTSRAPARVSAESAIPFDEDRDVLQKF
jgi:methyl-accepting chemotaxis protein